MRTIIFIQLLSFLAFSSCTKSDDLEPNYSSETNGKTTALFNPDLTYGTVMDIDGNVYKTINIDGITWMAENLRTTKYNDGTKIPNIKNNDDWKLLQNGAYRNYMDDNNAADIATYGRLYNYYAVESGKLA